MFGFFKSKIGEMDSAILVELLRAAGVQVEFGELLPEDRKGAFQRLASAASKRETTVQLIRFRHKDGGGGECLLVMSPAPALPATKKVLDTDATPALALGQSI